MYPLVPFLWLLLFVTGGAPQSKAEFLQWRNQGLNLSAVRLADRIILCLQADDGWRLSSDYGVELSVPSDDKRLWGENFPKLVTGPERYFQLPLRIDLRTKATKKIWVVEVDLGACFKTDFCTPIKFHVMIPNDVPVVSSEGACVPG